MKTDMKMRGTVTFVDCHFPSLGTEIFKFFGGRLTGASSVARQRAPQLDLWEIEALLPVMEVSAKAGSNF